MVLPRTGITYNLAFAEDIPGTHCGPEDGPWPKRYVALTDGAIWSRLRTFAKPQTTQVGRKGMFKADSVNFQPAPTAKSQDRYVVTQLDVHKRTWTLTGVFDGHLGDNTVEHVAQHFPKIVQEFLEDAETREGVGKLTPKAISELLTRAMLACDDAIARDVLDLFGGSLEKLDGYTDSQISELINDEHKGGDNWKKVRISMYGTTALVALVDPEQKNLWVANLGDCQALLVSPGLKGPTDWSVEVLTTTHNGDNKAELDRVKASHPGEPECVLGRRILGALAPTRCLGDIPFKQPASFTRRILYNLWPGFHESSPWEDFLLRIRTPPYVTAEPQVIHRQLDGDEPPKLELPPSLFATTSTEPATASGSSSKRKRPFFWVGSTPKTQPPPYPTFLILASDGFTDICSKEGIQTIVESWARAMVLRRPSISITDEEPGSKNDNMALRLLRRALGGSDDYRVSRALTLDMQEPWMDDTTIVVQTLCNW